MAVAFAALVIHGACLLELRHDPAFDLPIIDSGVYHAAAVRFASGQRLTDGVFWQPPLFPALLGCLYRIVGPSVVVARVVLVVLGSVSCVLVWAIARRLYGGGIAVAAGLILAVYGPFLFFGSQLLPVGLAIFLDLLTIVLWLEALARPTWMRWLAFGLVAGLATLTIPNAAVLFLLASVPLVVAAIGGVRRAPAIVSLLAATIGFAGPLAVTAARNYSVAGEWVPISTNAGINLFLGNNPDSRTTVAIRPGEGWRRLARQAVQHGALTHAEQDAYFLREAAAFILSEPRTFFLNLAQKSREILNAREIPRNVDPYLFREHSSILSALLWRAGGFAFPFGVLAPLAVVGMAAGLRDRSASAGSRRGRIVLAAFVVGYAATVVLFFISGRYRLPVVPVLAIFAAAGGAYFWQAFFRADAPAHGLPRAVGVAVLLFAGALVNFPVSHPTDGMNFRAELALCVGDAHAVRGRLEEAEVELRKAFELKPRYAEAAAKLAAVVADRGDLDQAERLIRQAVDWDRELVEFRTLLGAILRRQGRLDEAESVLQDALDADPTSPEAHAAYADLLSLRGDTIESIAHYSTALTFGDARGQTHLRLADALTRRSAYADAIRHYRFGIARTDADPETVNRFAWLLATCPQVEHRDCHTAIELATRACQATQYKNPATLDTLAAAFAECGKWDPAVVWARRAAELARDVGDAIVAETIEARLRQYQTRRDAGSGRALPGPLPPGQD